MSDTAAAPVPKVEKTEAEWRKKLSDEQFEVCFRRGTERAFTGAYWDNHDKGMYRCVACDAELFASDTKFDSGTGWPSFWAPAAHAKIATEVDNSGFMRRVEIRCAACSAHLGHVFDDGPEPTGERYCVNSAALKFVKAG